MATNKRSRATGRGKEHSFLQVPHYILQSEEFGRLSSWGVKLLIELAGLFRGHNNGNLSAAFSVLRKRGWRSAGTLSKALRELQEAGWIVCTRHGGKNRCSLFALTWWPIDACEGKCLELRPEHAARHSWKTISVVAMRTNLVAIRTNEVGEAA